MSDPVIYDQNTDSMYVTLREGRVLYSIAHDERDLAIDIGEDRQPVGYNIQFASRHPEIIAEALQVLQRGNGSATE